MKNKTNLYYPFYFDTQIHILDDEKKYLNSLERVLGTKFSVQTHEDCSEISNIAKETRSFWANIDELSQKVSAFDSDVERKKLDYSVFQKYFKQLNNLCSVLIIDYDMPYKTGLDICEEIKDSQIKKILLTAVADDKIAIDAFNKGIIDKFIRKKSTNLVSELENTIATLQDEFWTAVSKKFSQKLPSRIKELFESSGFKKLFCTILDQNNIHSYSIWLDEQTKIYLQSKSKSYVLYIRDEYDKKVDLEIAQDTEACPEKYQILSELENIPTLGIEKYLDTGEGIVKGKMINDQWSYCLQA